jgi:hypothetical protein
MDAAVPPSLHTPMAWNHTDTKRCHITPTKDLICIYPRRDGSPLRAGIIQLYPGDLKYPVPGQQRIHTYTYK